MQYFIKLFSLLDNGKSFGDPFHHEITILYPLYQV
jgi:hypothetical protein